MRHHFCVLLLMLISSHFSTTALVHCRALQDHHHQPEAKIETRDDSASRDRLHDQAPSTGAGVGGFPARKDSSSRPLKSLNQQVVFSMKEQVYKVAATGPSRKGSGH